MTYVRPMSANEPTTTRHTCGGPAFGRKTPGCPRCDEMLAGAPARQGYGSRRRYNQPQPFKMHAHTAACQPVCTYGDW